MQYESELAYRYAQHLMARQRFVPSDLTQTGPCSFRQHSSAVLDATSRFENRCHARDRKFDAMISVQLTLEQAHWLDKHLKAQCKMQSMLPHRGDGNSSDVLAEVVRAIEQQAVRVEPQPPAENYGVEVMFCHETWLCGYKPFKDGTARWGTAASPFGQGEVTVECVDGVWYWVRK